MAEQTGGMGGEADKGCVALCYEFACANSWDMVGTQFSCLQSLAERLTPVSVSSLWARHLGKRRGIRNSPLDLDVSDRVGSSPRSPARKPLTHKGETNLEMTERSRPRLPSFLVIGAMKAGTTSLYHYLHAHPQVFMPSIKELDFFVAGGNWGRGLHWYQKQFAGAGPGAVAVGEASTMYTKYPSVDGVPERIAAHLPEVRLVYVVRDPIDRIRSHYRHRVAVGTGDRVPSSKRCSTTRSMWTAVGTRLRSSGILSSFHGPSY